MSLIISPSNHCDKRKLKVPFSPSRPSISPHFSPPNSPLSSPQKRTRKSVEGRSRSSSFRIDDDLYSATLIRNVSGGGRTSPSLLTPQPLPLPPLPPVPTQEGGTPEHGPLSHGNPQREPREREELFYQLNCQKAQLLVRAGVLVRAKVFLHYKSPAVPSAPPPTVAQTASDAANLDSLSSYFTSLLHVNPSTYPLKISHVEGSEWTKVRSWDVESDERDHWIHLIHSFCPTAFTLSPRPSMSGTTDGNPYYRQDALLCMSVNGIPLVFVHFTKSLASSTIIHNVGVCPNMNKIDVCNMYGLDRDSCVRMAIQAVVMRSVSVFNTKRVVVDPKARSVWKSVYGSTFILEGERRWDLLRLWNREAQNLRGVMSADLSLEVIKKKAAMADKPFCPLMHLAGISEKTSVTNSEKTSVTNSEKTSVTNSEKTSVTTPTCVGTERWKVSPEVGAALGE